MNQAGLFDARPKLADCGPAPHVAVQTSIDAAVEIEPHVGLMREQVLALVRNRGGHGATDEEIRVALGLKGDTARARRCELRDAGLVRDSGQRRPTGCGRQSIAWVTTAVVLTPSRSRSVSTVANHIAGGGADGQSHGPGATALVGVHVGGDPAAVAMGISQEMPEKTDPEFTGNSAVAVAGDRRDQVADPCPKCRATEYVDVRIHDGQSVRRQCKGCGYHLGFPVWYGKVKGPE